MKGFAILVLISLLPVPLVFGQTGSSCGSPYTIQLDGVARTYATSSSTGNAVVCSSYTGSTPVTWFTFTTDASAEMPLLDLSVDDSTTCEIAMYTACNGGGILQTQSSMCFDDGWGLWAPAQNYTLSPNTSYHLRIKTAHATTIRITAKSYTPSNNLCSGATPIGLTPIHDNNACNKPSAEVTPAQLCAYTLENTAFYQFYIASTGVAIMNVSSIACDNIDNNNDNGIQIGFFTGSCGGLIPLSCAAGLGPFVQATTPALTAGTKVYVAIDGNAGSNCQYDIQALNAYGVLSTEEFQNFSVWETPSSNVLKWISNTDKNVQFIVERSGNGTDFIAIGQGASLKNNGSLINYKFEDDHPLTTSYYRVKEVLTNGQIRMSNTLLVEKKDKASGKVKLTNPVRNDLLVQITSEENETANYTIVSSYGEILDRGKLALTKGANNINKTIANFPSGQYVLTISSNTIRGNVSFIKLN